MPTLKKLKTQKESQKYTWFKYTARGLTECFEIGGAGNCKGIEDTMFAGIVEQAEFCRAPLSTHHGKKVHCF
jgi:hypothetical protein